MGPTEILNEFKQIQNSFKLDLIKGDVSELEKVE
jgi:hypothetical protein